MAKYFIDTEFIEKPNTIQLISIGIVCEDGREYYVFSSEYKYKDSSQWVKDNVILRIWQQTFSGDARNFAPSIKNFHKHFGTPIWKIKQQILNFLKDDKEPEFWGYYADYDWVVFCWIFGTMMELPEHFPKYCKDLKQLADEMPSIPKFAEPKDEHNALADARWNMDFYCYLKSLN